MLAFSPGCPFGKAPRPPKWTEAEIQTLESAVVQQGSIRDWVSIAKLLPGRSPKQCRVRWTSHAPGKNKVGDWETQEELVIALQHCMRGTCWSHIARLLGNGRTENNVKNHWNNLLRSKTLRRPYSLLWNYQQQVLQGVTGPQAVLSGIHTWSDHVPASDANAMTHLYNEWKEGRWLVFHEITRHVHGGARPLALGIPPGYHVPPTAPPAVGPTAQTSSGQSVTESMPAVQAGPGWEPHAAHPAPPIPMHFATPANPPPAAQPMAAAAPPVPTLAPPALKPAPVPTPSPPAAQAAPAAAANITVELTDVQAEFQTGQMVMKDGQWYKVVGVTKTGSAPAPAPATPTSVPSHADTSPTIQVHTPPVNLQISMSDGHQMASTAGPLMHDTHPAAATAPPIAYVSYQGNLVQQVSGAPPLQPPPQTQVIQMVASQATTLPIDLMMSQGNPGMAYVTQTQPPQQSFVYDASAVAPAANNSTIHHAFPAGAAIPEPQAGFVTVVNNHGMMSETQGMPGGHYVISDQSGLLGQVPYLQGSYMMAPQKSQPQCVSYVMTNQQVMSQSMPQAMLQAMSQSHFQVVQMQQPC